MSMRKCLVILLLIGAICSFTAVPGKASDCLIDPVKTWVVLMEKNHYPQGYTNLEVNFINSKQMHDSLAKIGVEESHFLITKDDLTPKTVNDALIWLVEKTQPGDFIIFYIAAHGNWIGRELAWNSWFPPTWADLADRNKTLIINSCLSGSFIQYFADHQTDGLYLATAAARELSWWGLEEEGLPIIGDIWTFYFTEGLFNPAVDDNQNGIISIEEAFKYAAGATQQYMKETVFVVKEFKDSYRQMGINVNLYPNYPNPVIYDNLAGELGFYQLP